MKHFLAINKAVTKDISKIPPPNSNSTSDTR